MGVGGCPFLGGCVQLKAETVDLLSLLWVCWRGKSVKHVNTAESSLSLL